MGEIKQRISCEREVLARRSVQLYREGTENLEGDSGLSGDETDRMGKGIY